MKWNSRHISSSQTDIHPNLEKIVRKHLQTEFKKPFHPANLEVFEKVLPDLQNAGSIILDSGCGVGESSIRIALKNPHALVIGVDKSIHRLEKNKAYMEKIGQLPENLLLFRGDLVDWWRLLADAGIRLEKHFILYPNPWPKSEHLKRRWHAHPVFPSLLKLGGQVILRTNWNIYAKEFAQALRLATGKTPAIYRLYPSQFMSPFERKYYNSCHELYEIKFTITN